MYSIVDPSKAFASGPLPDIGDVERPVREAPKLWSGRDSATLST
jgi:hypothetical protein